MIKDRLTRGSTEKLLVSFVMVLLLTFVSLQNAMAQPSTHERAIFACMAIAMETAEPGQTIGMLREQCNKSVTDSVSKRNVFEQSVVNNPFAILPYKPNFVLPVTYSKANDRPYASSQQEWDLNDVEAKFQFSIKYIAKENLFTDDLDVHMAFTTTSWWQSYNGNLSAPFRETNYEPEIILNYDRPWNLLGLPIVNRFVSFNHQSNGKSNDLSRSWNRVIAGATFSTKNYVWTLKTWWRFPEKQKESEDAAKGDDNPNIEKYLGYGELGTVWHINDDHNIDVFLRNNLRSDNKGAIKLGWSFPLSRRLRGFVEYFNGYGESLIYFDQHSERIGFGVKLTDWL